MAQSLLEASFKEMAYTMDIKLDENSAATIVRNIYENFRMVGKAVLVFKGIEPESDHIESIKELLKFRVKTERPIGLLDNLRRLRNDVNYNGYRPTLAKACFIPLHLEAKKFVNVK